ncbi:1-acyl-sn-glycerol-3-phosphate acyltransferase [Rhodobacterales bacterium HKCCE3408]|nr:1-acyl-sn-glycerol-3-phosphate acyltransferase [Rhodobacterales bacterium HKCCE3408]
MVTWAGREPPVPEPIPVAGWAVAILRGVVILAILLVAFPLKLLLRLPEAGLVGARRPVTPWITVVTCRAIRAIFGLRVTVEGVPMTGPGAFVANHVSWLDIFMLNACAPMVFVAKAEVAGWPGIGWLARGTGTVFVERRRGAAAREAAQIAARLAQGQRMAIFAEGTSTDGLRVLPFKSTIFGPFFTSHGLAVQPVTLHYMAPRGAREDFYGWWGDMPFGPSLLRALAQVPQGRVRITFHAPIAVGAESDRKTLARAAETAVRDGLSAGARSGP